VRRPERSVNRRYRHSSGTVDPFPLFEYLFVRRNRSGLVLKLSEPEAPESLISALWLAFGYNLLSYEVLAETKGDKARTWSLRVKGLT
jgi:hypothetical protein